MFRVRLVCEGPTDLEVLRAVLGARLDTDYQLTLLQPEGSLYGGDAGPHGGGWKGVRSWCMSVARAGGLESVGALAADTDLLIIHVDADIAGDLEEVGLRPCPPPMDTVAAVAAAVLRWLNLDQIPPRVALWVPAMATESWLLAAFFPGDSRSVPCEAVDPGAPCVECLADPARALLHRAPRFVRMKQGELKKQRRTYQAQAPAFAQSWDRVVSACASARWLDDQLRQALA